MCEDSKSSCPSPTSAFECMILQEQVRRRAKYRQEFLRLKSDPCKHATESGYVFDPALQRFYSMKVTQFDHFRANPRTSLMGVMFIVVPMFTYGYLIWNDRNNKEQLIRSGKIKYRDRLFKLK